VTIRTHHFVFVNGLHRSGTSILYRVLSAQPGFSGFSNTGVSEDEGQHLQTVFRAANQHGGPGLFGFDSACYLTEQSELVTEDNRARLFEQWSKHWDLSASVLVEKSPPNLIRTRFLQALFERSSFISILRHPIAVSFATQKWSRTSLESLLRHWLICHRCYARDRERLRSELLFKYEEFTEEPERILDRISGLLGRQLELPREWTIERRINDKYFEMWRDYQQGFRARRRARALVDQYEEQFNEFGYSLILKR